MSASLSEKDQKRFLAAIRRMTPENLSRFVQNTEYMSKLELSRRQSAEGRVVVKTMNELNEMAQ
jgi:hypothetical protein